MPWRPGEIVIWREAWRGRTYMECPVRVVRDDESETVVYLAEGTRFTFPPGGWPFGDAHPWARKGGWRGHGVLVQHSPGAAHAVWHFWESVERRFAGWYVNMQAPFARDGDGFLTQDHELDLWITADGAWQWKDEQELVDWIRRGRFTQDEVAAIRAEGERVLAEWPFPTGWEGWLPDPAWPAPTLRSSPPPSPTRSARDRARRRA